MASDFSKPLVSDAYATLLPTLVTELQDIVRGLEPTATGTHTNIPTNTIRWNAANIYWEKYNGTSWAALASPYAISISGNAGTVTNGVYTTTIASLAPSLTGTGASGTWGISISGNAATVTNGVYTTTIASLAPTLTGGGASGSWGISITGTAANATTAAACSGNSATATSATTATNIAGGAVGYLPYQSGAGVTALLAAGTAGQKLLSNGGAAPSWGSSVVSGTTVATTSGTSIDFTGIPSWAKRITVMLNGVSTNGTSFIQFQLGSGSPQTTGYAVGCFRFGAASGNGQSFSTGFGLNIATATDTYGGTITFNTLGSNIWTGQATIGSNGSTFSFIAAGAVTLGGVLDRVRITTVNGTDTFDAGSVNIIWE